MKTTNRYHMANQARWDAASAGWARGADSRGDWRRCPKEPELALCPKELEALGDVSEKRVCVLGSGNNEVVFALAGLGASVTSVDISQNQLAVAARRAEELGLAVSFVQADVTDLATLEDRVFDAVYTGGHVAVWVADLERYYREAARILRSGGLFIVNEYHPFRRVWRDSKDALVIESRYLDRGPFEYESTADVLHPEPGQFKSYEFHWTIADYLNTVLKAGCHIESVDEYGEEVADWEGAPMQGLPEFFLVVARKR